MTGDDLDGARDNRPFVSLNMMAALVAGGIGGIARPTPSLEAFTRLDTDLIAFGGMVYDETSAMPAFDYSAMRYEDELPWFTPTKRRPAVRPDLAAPTFKSKRVKANRARKRAARKARRAQS